MKNDLHTLAKLLRYDILTSTSAANAGHPSSSLSAVELMTVLFFDGYLHTDLTTPTALTNDRVIFSKGHAAPLLYSLYHAAGVLPYDELLQLRSLSSPLEGHPTPAFKYIDVATGSLGQGLSAGMGMALAIKQHMKDLKVPNDQAPRVWVLLGDSEMSEGQVWEALQLVSHYGLDNLIGILDVNRLGQRGETMVGWNIDTYQKRITSFGWNTIVIENGNNLAEVQKAFALLNNPHSHNLSPTMIIAKTKKGAGVNFLEDKENWHGKPVPKDKLDEVLHELGEVDRNLKGTVSPPSVKPPSPPQKELSIIALPTFDEHTAVATREAYGDGLTALAQAYPNVVALDGEVSNSTFSEKLKAKYPERFFEMYIAEQNMVSAAVGMSKLGYVPFVSSFAAFLTRAFDQIRMAAYSDANVKFVGSHAGVSIGSDGSSQMGLEDIAMFKSILNSIIFYPSDAVSTVKLIEQIYKHRGVSYLRTTREKTSILYSQDEEFKIGGSKTLRSSEKDTAVVFATGITVHEALKAYDSLKQKSINIAVVDLYSVKPLDEETINVFAQKTDHVVVVEDHYPGGSIAESVKMVLRSNPKFISLAVRKIPHSGKPEELLAFQQIDADAIEKAVLSFS